MKWRVTISLIFLQSLIVNSLLSQDIYQTKHGTLEIFTRKPELVAHSKKLDVLLDYKNAFVEFILPLHTLHVTSDSLNYKLNIIENLEIYLKADLQIERINTQNHPKQHFHFVGEMSYKDRIISIYGEGHLEHLIGNEEISCLLGLSFWLPPSSFSSLDMELLGIDSLKVQIVQTVLNEKI